MENKTYLTFKLGTEQFAVHVRNVLNILEMVPVTSVPQSPAYMKGVINLRGTVLPVVDIGRKFEMEETTVTSETCIVVMDFHYGDEKIHVGAMVDEVVSVMELEQEEIQPVSQMLHHDKVDFLSGFVQKDELFIMILDFQKVFSLKELEGLENVNV